MQNNIPVYLPHLEERMRQTKHLQTGEKFEKKNCSSNFTEHLETKS
jgi:hypothetical protein